MKAELVVRGISVAEGPTWRGRERDLIVASVSDGLLWRVDPMVGRKAIFADTTGGPSGVALCSDGGVLVAQNGGLDFAALAVPEWQGLRPPRWTVPCLQRVAPEGRVSGFCGHRFGLQQPNDLVVAPDGSVIFTDPNTAKIPGMGPPRICRYRSDGAAVWGAKGLGGDDRLEVLAEIDDYLNGLALSPSGRILVVEQRGLRWLDKDGTRSWLIEVLDDDHRGDGMAFDIEGNVYVCVPGIGVRIVGFDGKLAGELPFGPGHLTLNCCFGGNDLRTLFVTDAGRHVVWAFDRMPIPGVPLYAYDG